VGQTIGFCRLSGCRALPGHDRVEKVGQPILAAAVFQRLLKKFETDKLSRRSTLMNADKAIVFNLRSSVFIGGQR
jgi:hypothetical protein